MNTGAHDSRQLRTQVPNVTSKCLLGGKADVNDCPALQRTHVPNEVGAGRVWPGLSPQVANTRPVG